MKTLHIRAATSQSFELITEFIESLLVPYTAHGKDIYVAGEHCSPGGDDLEELLEDEDLGNYVAEWIQIPSVDPDDWSGSDTHHFSCGHY